MVQERAVELMEADIPGASLGGCDQEKFKIAELKFWLCCCDATGLTKLKTKLDYGRGATGLTKLKTNVVMFILIHLYCFSRILIIGATALNCYNFLTYRVKTYTNNGWDSRIVDPDP